jgi:sterol desaturase/sphingolipid hydroxylase (fatty acid hydroxylase superfamily)
VADSLPTAVEWVRISAFWLFLFALLLLELLLPIHARPREAKGRLVANFGLGLLNAAIFAMLPISTVLAAQWAADQGVGLLTVMVLPATIAFAVTIMLRSLSAYGLHVLTHKVCWLWRIHRVHHADVAVDLSTGFRHHPAELIIVAVCHAGVAVMLGLSVPALVVYEAIAVSLSLWSHVNLRLPFPLERGLNLLLVTPAVHHVHHSSRKAETDSNYGELLTIWDRLFRTFSDRSLEQVRALPIGLGESFDGDSPRLGKQLTLPLRAA